MIRILVSLLTLTLLSSSCATSQDSIFFGMTTGAAIGGGFGAAVGHSDHNELRAGAVGLVSGAIIGGLLGYLTHKDQAYKATRNELPRDKVSTPSLTKPVVRRVWVPDKVEGEKLVRGHWVYILEKSSGWRDDSP